MTTKPSDEAIVAFMREECRTDTREPGWLTAAEIADRINKPRKVIQQRLDRAFGAGEIERKKQYIVVANGRSIETYVYHVGEQHGKASGAS